MYWRKKSLIQIIDHSGNVYPWKTMPKKIYNTEEKIEYWEQCLKKIKTNHE